MARPKITMEATGIGGLGCALAAFALGVPFFPLGCVMGWF